MCGPVVQIVAKICLHCRCVWHGLDVVQYWLRCGKLCVHGMVQRCGKVCGFSVSGRGPGMCDMIQRWFSCA